MGGGVHYRIYHFAFVVSNTVQLRMQNLSTIILTHPNVFGYNN